LFTGRYPAEQKIQKRLPLTNHNQRKKRGDEED